MTLGALQMRPRLRPDLTIVRRVTHGTVNFIVKEPREGKYSQFGETEMALMRLMDGSRTPADIAADVGESLGFTPESGAVADFGQRLKRMGLVERTPAEEHLMLMERLRADRKVRARSRTKGSILRIRWSIGDPDRLFDRWVGRLAWMWTPGFVAASLLLFVAYVVVVATRWDEIARGAAGLYTGRGVTVWDYVLSYAILLFVIGIHELGHGLTTKRFGGHVHEIGAMLLYFSPALFCNTNDAWLFERRSQRLWVTFAGPWIQLLLVAFAAVAWLFMEPGTLLYHVTFLTVLVGGLSNVMTNMNPLIPLDGYYALSDWLEIPNLRQRAFGYWGWLIKRHLLRVPAAEPAVTPRERRVFLVYGALAFAYGVLFAVLSLVWITLILRGWLGPWVWVLVAYLLGKTVWRQRGRLAALGGAAVTAGRGGFVRGRAAAIAGGALVLVVALPFLLPWTFRADGPARVESAPRARLRAPVAGILDAVHVREGDTVATGEPLARIWSAELTAREIEMQGRVGRLAVAEATAAARGDRAAASAARAELEAARGQLERLQARLAAAELRAPAAGIVVAPRIEERLGEWLEEGADVLEVVSVDRRTAWVRVPLRDARGLAAGQVARLKFASRPGVVFASRVAEVAPAAGEDWIEARVPLAGGPPLPAPGTMGRAKIVTDRGTVAGALGRAGRRLLRLDLWI